MAVFNSFSTNGPKKNTASENPFISTNMYSADEVPEQSIYEVQKIEANSSFSSNYLQFRSSPAVNIYNGIQNIEFIDIFRGRLHYLFDGDLIDGETLNYGIVSQDLNIVYGVHNAFEELVEIETISVTADQGISVSGLTAGDIFNPLEERPINLLINAEGSALIMAEISIKLVGVSTIYSFFIEALRVILFPFLPEAPFNESLEWLNDVQTSLTGKETRSSLRKIPRKYFSFDIKISNIQEKTMFENLIQSRQAKLLGIPSWHELTVLDYDLVSTDQIINIDTTKRSYRVDRSVVIWDGYDNYSVIAILSILPNQLTLKNEIGSNYSSGAFIMPLYTGYAGKSTLYNESAAQNVNIGVSFDIKDEVNLETTYTPTLTYESKPVLTNNYLFNRNKRKLRVNGEYSLIDYNLGDFTNFTLREYNTKNYSYGMRFESFDEIYEMKEFLYWSLGRNKSFWISSMSKAFIMYETALVTSTQIRVNKNGGESFVNDNIIRKHLIFSYGTCNYFFAEILSIVESDDYETILLDTGIPIEFTTTNVNISFLVPVRLNKERTSIEWIDTETAEIKLDLIEVDN